MSFHQRLQQQIDRADNINNKLDTIIDKIQLLMAENQQLKHKLDEIKERLKEFTVRPEGYSTYWSYSEHRLDAQADVADELLEEFFKD